MALRYCCDNLPIFNQLFFREGFCYANPSSPQRSRRQGGRVAPWIAGTVSRAR